MTFGDLRIKIKKAPKVVAQNLKIAKRENYIYQDGLKQYNLTYLGKIAIGNVVRQDSFTRWQIETQEVDPVELSGRPKAMCTLITERAEKIKEIDDKTASPRFSLETTENNTLIRSALARVVDSILATLEKDLGLSTVRDGELAENSLLASSGHLDYFPSYDYLKRYKNLANIDFKLLIEFNGKEWLKIQKLGDLEKRINNNRKSINEYYHKNILSSDQRKRIHDTVLDLLQIREDYYKFAFLSKDKQEMREHIIERFRLHGEQKDNLEEIVIKGFECGLFQPQKKTFLYLRVNPEKYRDFIESLENEGELTTD